MEVINSQFFPFGQLLTCLLVLGCVQWSEVEPAKTEFHSFVREQRQVKVSGSRYRVSKDRVFVLCNQPGLRSRRILHRCSIMFFLVILVFWCFFTCAVFRCFSWQLLWWGVFRSRISSLLCLSMELQSAKKKQRGQSHVSRILCVILYSPRGISSLRLGLACWTLQLLPQLLLDTASSLTLGEQLEWKMAMYSLIWSPVRRKLCGGGRHSRIHGSVG